MASYDSDVCYVFYGISVRIEYGDEETLSLAEVKRHPLQIAGRREGLHSALVRFQEGTPNPYTLLIGRWVKEMGVDNR